eukprot:g10478.t1
MYGYNAQQAYGSLPGPLKKNEPKVTLPFQAVFLSWLIPTALTNRSLYSGVRHMLQVSGAASSSLVTYYPFLIYGILAVVTAGSLLTLHIVLIVLRRRHWEGNQLLQAVGTSMLLVRS